MNLTLYAVLVFLLEGPTTAIFKVLANFWPGQLDLDFQVIYLLPSVWQLHFNRIRG